MVRISDYDLASFFRGSQVYHGIVLQKFTSYSTRTDQKHSTFLDDLIQLVPNDSSYAFVSVLCLFIIHLFQKLLGLSLGLRQSWDDFSEFSKKVLVNGHVFTCDSLECFLSR